MKQLVGFARISLGAGELRDLTAEIDMKQLIFHDLNMDQVVEPEELDLFIAYFHKISGSKDFLRLSGSSEDREKGIRFENNGSITMGCSD